MKSLKEKIVFWLEKLEATTDKQPDKESHGISRGIAADILLKAFSAELEDILNEINTFQEHAEEPNPTLKRVNKAIFKRLEQARKELNNG